MKHLFALTLLALVQRTRPDGSPLFLAPPGVVSVTTPTWGECNGNSHSVVRTLSGGFCVTETPEQVRKIFYEQA